jgi:hypothetical protein
MSEGGGHELSNLVALCELCHRAEHTGREPPTRLGERASSLRKQITETDDSSSAHARIGADYLEGVATIMKSMALFFQTGKAGALVRDIRQVAEMASNWRRQTIDTETHLDLLEEAHADADSEIEHVQRDVEEYIRTGRVATRQAVEILETMARLQDTLEGVCKCSDCRSPNLTEGTRCAECGGGSIVLIADSERVEGALKEMSDLMDETRELVSSVKANEGFGATVSTNVASQD